MHLCYTELHNYPWACSMIVLLMTANKPETALYRTPTFSILLLSHGGLVHTNILSLPPLQLLLWYVPLTFYLNHLLSLAPSRRRFLLLFLYRLTILSLFLLHCGWCVTFSPYGRVALVLSPGISWTIPLSLYLLLRAHRIHYKLTAHV